MSNEEKNTIERAVDVIFGASELQPLVNFCRKTCAGDLHNCVRSAFGFLGGYSGYGELHSPLEKLISSKKYFASKRFEAELIDKIDNSIWNKKSAKSQICPI